MGTLAVALVVLDGLSLLRVDRQEDGLVGTLAVALVVLDAKDIDMYELDGYNTCRII